MLAAGWFLENAWLIPLIPGIAFFVIILVRQAPADEGLRGRHRLDGRRHGALHRRRRAVDPADERRRRGRSSPRSSGAGRGGRTTACELSIGMHIDGLVGDGALPRRVHLAARADLLARVRARRPPLHPLLRRDHAVLRRHARDGPRREHGPADPRLGDHGPLLVPAHRPLVGGRAQRPRRAEGVLHRPRRRRRPARRHVSMLYFGSNAWAAGAPRHAPGSASRRSPAWALSGEASHTVLLWAAVALFIALHRQERPVPAAHLVARRHGRSDAGVVAAALLDDGRRRRVPRRPALPGVLGGLRDPGVERSTSSSSIAAITIVISGLLAFVQNDIKKVLAYSTVGQLGYMMLGLGAGAWLPAVFHIFTHAFFKCCLFLCAGSVSHSGSHHSFDMKKDMGGLRQEDADHDRGVDRRVAGPRRHVPVRRVLLQGRDHRQRRPQRLRGVHVDRPRRRRPHRDVHRAGDLPHVLRRAPRRGGRRAVSTRRHCTRAHHRGRRTDADGRPAAHRAAGGRHRRRVRRARAGARRRPRPGAPGSARVAAS